MSLDDTGGEGEEELGGGVRVRVFVAICRVKGVSRVGLSMVMVTVAPHTLQQTFQGTLRLPP